MLFYRQTNKQTKYIWTKKCRLEGNPERKMKCMASRTCYLWSSCLLWYNKMPAMNLKKKYKCKENRKWQKLQVQESKMCKYAKFWILAIKVDLSLIFYILEFGWSLFSVIVQTDHFCISLVIVWPQHVTYIVSKKKKKATCISSYWPSFRKQCIKRIAQFILFFHSSFYGTKIFQDSNTNHMSWAA